LGDESTGYLANKVAIDGAGASTALGGVADEVEQRKFEQPGVEHRKPNAADLSAGAAGIGILAYTAHLGGKLVYDDGVGVEPAHGVYRPDAPALKVGQFGAFFRTAPIDLWHGVQHMIEEVEGGKFVPTIVAWYKAQRGVPRQVDSTMAA